MDHKQLISGFLGGLLSGYLAYRILSNYKAQKDKQKKQNI